MADDPKPASVLGKIKDKLIASKQQWAKDGRLLTGATPNPAVRLPPGQREVKNWPVLDLGLQPDVPKEAWQLTVDGLVENKLDWNWGQFTNLPQLRLTSDIHCVTAWSRYDNDWDGVATATILDLARPRPEAKHIIFHSYDGYTTNVTMESFAAPDALLAHSWMGEPISREHGGPVRVVVPKLYFWKSAKWLRRIEFSASDQPGFWETRGYHNEADPWEEERYS
jgi:DMSO/TMAO reductase YedYZ molybdopterin-dependent catalytic subunit